MKNKNTKISGMQTIQENNTEQNTEKHKYKYTEIQEYQVKKQTYKTIMKTHIRNMKNKQYKH